MNQQKSGTACCCSAYRGSGIALSSEQATRVHADVYSATRIHAHIGYIHTNGHLCYNVLDDYEFTRFL